MNAHEFASLSCRAHASAGRSKSQATAVRASPEAKLPLRPILTAHNAPLAEKACRGSMPRHRRVRRMARVSCIRRSPACRDECDADEPHSCLTLPICVAGGCSNPSCLLDLSEHRLDDTAPAFIGGNIVDAAGDGLPLPRKRTRWTRALSGWRLRRSSPAVPEIADPLLLSESTKIADDRRRRERSITS
jgi:hypothetical protein